MVKDIVVWPAKVLREPCVPVESAEELNAIVKDLWDTLKKHGGVGLAAPQIGIAKQVFILDRTAFDLIKEPIPFSPADGDCLVFANPVIHETSVETEDSYEGCLSFPDIFLKFERPLSARIVYQDDTWQSTTLEARGFLTRAILHENDHLNGVLFTKYVGSLKRSMVEKKMMKRRK